MDQLIKRTLLFALKIYQVSISPYFAPCCRFHPTCSEYARQALHQCRVPRALFLICKRLLRCHPFCKGGIDCIPSNQR